jgi:hypothetical protein
MVRINRRRLRTRRFARPAKSSEPLPPIDLDVPGSASTEFAVEAVKAQSAPRSSQQDSTVELKAMPHSDPNDETAEAITVDATVPPDRMKFSCPCGAELVATSDMYDKHTRCGMCQTVLLTNLVYDAETRSHEIIPFRVNPESGV